MVERIEADVLVAGGGMGGLMATTRAHLVGARVVFLTGLPGASVRMEGFATALLDAAEDRGDQFRIDHPYRDDLHWLGNIVTELAPDGSGIAASFRRAGIGARGTAPLP